MMRRCPRCGKTKPVADFKRGRYLSWCLTCHGASEKTRRESNPEKYRERQKQANLRHKFGIEPEEYEALLAEQGGVCAICGRPETTYDPRWKKKRDLAVDHDHVTDEVRGLLCGACNRALGLLGDDPERMRAAAAYVERPL